MTSPDDNTVEEGEEKDTLSTRPLLWAALSSVVFVVVIAIVGVRNHSVDQLNELGDFIGGVAGPLLATLSFLALLYTIMIQSRELSLSRLELTLTRGELERSASALENQNTNLERQRLSQSFFDLFEMYTSVVSGIVAGPSDNRVSGKAALEVKAKAYRPYHWTGQDDWNVEAIKSEHDKQNDDLGNYYRIIFRLFSYLDEQGEGAEFYADMFRAQLTTSELHLLFYNCVSDVGKPLEEFAKRFELFDNMPIPIGGDFSPIASELDELSFGKNEALKALKKN